MGKRRNTSGTDKQRAAIALILIVLIIIGDIVSGAIGLAGPVSTAVIGCNNPASLEQCGTGNCIPANSNPNYCTVTVTFSPAFANIPKYASAQVTGCHSPECHTETQQFPMSGVTFQSDNGETWANMPVVKTEVYGNSRHEVQVLTTASMVAAEFLASCITGSSSATATLRPEFSTDGGSTWTELAGNTGFLDILVDATNCSFSAAFVSGPSGINPLAIGATILLRVVGLNGGGAGDNVVFNNLELVFFGVFGNQYLICIQGASPFVCISGASMTKTQMFISITRMAPAISGLGTAISVNWIATE